MTSSRYIIGIDLGTTNTAVAYVDLQSAEQRLQVWEVPQLVGPGQVLPRAQLPSFLYNAGAHDLAPQETALPWEPNSRRVVGELARSQGARVPARMVASAKSWLCHPKVDRHAKILPWRVEDPDDNEASLHKMSPVEASTHILEHIRGAWDHRFEQRPDARFTDQLVIVTVPASFDEDARDLTVEAARRAGLEQLVLLEEPQAAFYSWVDANPPGRRAELIRGDSHILVFDMGGGTTDFTLIRVDPEGQAFERTAVGEHLLLGGDNIDLTLAKQLEARIVPRRGNKLDLLEWHGLVHSCRLAKERLLADDSLPSAHVAVAGRGARLIGGAIKEEITRKELDAVLIDGFFPLVEADVKIERRRGGLTEFGLPYAADPRVTAHLAEFLRRHQATRIDAVLFNGGAMTPKSLRRRILDQLAAWQDGQRPSELESKVPELAVARGAAYYGLVRRGLGARIRGGTPRVFYVGVQIGGDGPHTESSRAGVRPPSTPESRSTAICVAPKGLEEGSTVDLDRDFELLTNRPVSFRLYSSTSRDDQLGALLPVGNSDDILELPPIVTVLRARGRARVTVRIEVKVTELGTLELYCIDKESAEKWRLTFDMRAGGAARTEDSTPADSPELQRARELVKSAFSSGDSARTTSLMRELEETLGARRDEWSLTAARALFDAAMEVEEQRKNSAEHETRWLHLTGFCLRPGSGAPLDDWRIKQMWRIFNEGLTHGKQEAARLAWWIAWRRIAGGLGRTQQEQIYDRLAQLFLPGANQKKKWHEVKPSRQEAAEMWRTLANLERLNDTEKVKLGEELLRRLETRAGRAEAIHFWAIGRIGNRAPLYGPLNAVVPVSHVEGWLEKLLATEWPEPEKAAFAMAQLGRQTGDRARDIDERLRGKLATRLRSTPGGDRTARLVEEVVALEAREERVALGDTLPAGLRLVTDG